MAFRTYRRRIPGKYAAQCCRHRNPSRRAGSGPPLRSATTTAWRSEFKWVAATLQSVWKDGVLKMKYRQRSFNTDKQKSETWDRWQRGESISRGLAAKRSFRSIARIVRRLLSTISREIGRNGGRRQRQCNFPQTCRGKIPQLPGLGISRMV
uniref:helix-turn-helix domain-containing protein n=1 Tax=Parasedimentitalea psychrophila TaxID=2997337 RepID=UPI0036F1BCDE